jgi:Fe-S cluster assembly protein SufD
VYKGCNAVQASQVNKNLLLSPGARALSIPKLEIETDDVQCRHDATIGKLNAEQLFYLQSRGLSHAQAQHDLVEAFLG